MNTDTQLLRAALLAGLLGACVLAPAMAQTPDTVDPAATVVEDDDDDGFDWGLLGLLGLLGLIPRKRHEVVRRDDVPPRTR